jgi:SAM-dependent methyltransferase
MKVLEFKYFDSSDDSVEEYFDGHCWSRPYEYCKVESQLREHVEEGSKIHNTSWGFEGPHVQFKECIDELKMHVFHTDIIPSTLENTGVYDITQSPKEEWKESFDAVVNISTVEEVPFDHVTVMKNLLDMVKPGGYLFITFDLPGLQLETVEQFVGASIQDTKNRLTGNSSKFTNPMWGHLTCGYLAIQK